MASNGSKVTQDEIHAFEKDLIEAIRPLLFKHNVSMQNWSSRVIHSKALEFKTMEFIANMEFLPKEEVK